MKKFATLMLALAMLISCAAIGMAEDITLDVIICQYGTQTNDWFTGTGMNGTSFVKKFEEANPGIKLNLEVVSWNDVYTVVSTRISNNNAPDILNLDSFADYANEGLLMPVKDYCPEELYNDFFPSFIEQSVIDGTVWAVPDLASARALYYNVDLLEAAGVEVPTRAYVASFGFKGSDQQKLTGVLSGGERNRLNLALTLKQGGNLLLLDEPTNDLDVETLESLENALLGFPGCAVVISHDRWFLDRVATHILAWEGDDENPAKWYWFEGNFQAYQENRIARLGEAAARPHRLHRKLTR